MARENLTTPVVVQTANSSLETVVTAMRHGAADFFVKPVAPERLIISLRNALKLGELETLVRQDRSRHEGTLSVADIITRSPEMDRLLALCARAARSPIPVMIDGETGTGKELVARVIQGSGDRAGKPFVTVNCGVIPANLLESTLFGHRKGAFAGATADREGKFAEAHGGTIFLDGIGELPPETQMKLLRVLQEGEIEPIGGRPQRVNVRVISATSRRLLNLARDGAFREDLYYRLNVFPIYVPPLRDRPEDIAPLVEHFIARFAAEEGKSFIRGVTAPALQLLSRYNWPGNIRQLENAVFRAVVLADEPMLTPEEFPQIAAHVDGAKWAEDAAEAPTPAASAEAAFDAAGMPAVEEVELDFGLPKAPAPAGQLTALGEDGEIRPLAEIEAAMIRLALERYSGRMTQVARKLGIGRSTLYRKLKDLGISDTVAGIAAE
jgi:DNA-binding NtrC family response regulator